MKSKLRVKIVHNVLFTLIYKINTHQLHESAERNLSHWDTDVHQSFNGRPKTTAFICSCVQEQSIIYKSNKILKDIL